MDLIRINVCIDLILNMRNRSLHRILLCNSERRFFPHKWLVIVHLCLSGFHMILNIFSDFFELFARTVLVGTHKCTISVIELLAYSFPLRLAFRRVLMLAAMVLVQAHV